jgi:hypothetical protein
MNQNGQLSKDTLVWKQGMENWEKAGNVDDLKSIFVEIPPIPSE